MGLNITHYKGVFPQDSSNAAKLVKKGFLGVVAETIKAGFPTHDVTSSPRKDPAPPAESSTRFWSS